MMNADESQESEEPNMNCINCYQEIPEGARFCPYCGAKQPEETANMAEQQNRPGKETEQENYSYTYTPDPVQMSGQPVNATPYLVLAIVFTAVSVICCCPLSTPFGIVAIVYAAKIKKAVQTGDWEEARHAASMARIWLIVAGVLFVLGFLFSIIIGALNSEFYIRRYYDWY